MNKAMLALLYRSFDEQLTPAEQQQLEEALREDSQLREEQKQIAAIRERLSSAEMPQFRPFFAERVMSSIRRAESSVSGEQFWLESLLQMFRPVAITAAVLLIALMVFNMTRTDQYSLSGALASPQVSLEEAVDPTLILALEMPE